MNFLRSSIISKLFLHLLLFASVAAGLIFYFYKSEKLFGWEWLAGFVGFCLVFFLIFCYWDLVRPLKVVLRQMQALLAGKPYKKIYTARLDEVGILAYFFNQVTKSFGKVSEDIKDRERMLDELTIAAQLQKDILPFSNPQVEGLQIVAKNKPATELGGDIFNFLNAKGRTYIYIGDVTGHGVAAGLIMTMAHSLITIFADIFPSPYEILVNVNRYLRQHVKKAMFLTLVMLCWDASAKKMTFVGAGHEYILIYRPDSGECKAILSGGVALGMVPDNSKMLKEQEITLNEGDLVVLYSDGIVEAKNPAGEMFGLERLKKALMEYGAEYSAEGVNYHIAKQVSAFVAGHGQDDDMSLIVIKRDSARKAALVQPETEKEIGWEI